MASNTGLPSHQPTFTEALLPELLLDRGWLSPDQIAEALAAQQAAVTPGALWISNRNDYALHCQALPGDEATTIQLPVDRNHPPTWQATSWVPWGTGFVALFDPETCEHVQELSPTHDAVGLAVVDGVSYLHTPSLWQNGWAARSSVLYHDRIPLKGLPHLPLDLTWADARLYLADRGAGIVHGIDAASKRYLGYVAVRPAGSKKALHVAPLPDGRKFLITDNHSGAAWIADGQGQKWKVKRQPLAYGTLGNITLSPDGQWAYALATRPGPSLELLILEARNLVLAQAIPLRGEPFSLVDDPCDLMALSPNGRFLLAMTYVNRPKLLTPLVTVIDLVDGPEKVYEYLLEEDNKPTNLAWWTRHPQPVPSLVDIIADRGWADRVALANLQLELAQPPAIQLKPPAVEIVQSGDEGDFPVLDQHLIDPALLGAFPEKALRAYTFLPLNQEGRTLTVAVVDSTNDKLEALFAAALGELEIVRIVISDAEFQRFLDERYPIIVSKYQAILARHAPPAVPEPPPPPRNDYAQRIATGDPIQIDELIVQALLPLVPADKVDDALPDLFAEAARLREALVHQERAAIQLPQWGITHDITQRWLVEALHPPTDTEAATEAPPVPPPASAAPMRAPASPEPLAHLAPQTVLLCHGEAQRVVELGPTGEAVWMVAAPQGVTEPRCASRLASGNTLISDGDRVVEYGRSGAVYAQIGGPELRFVKPHRAARLLNGHTLIADRGQHRVLEVDEQGKVVWQYGFAGSLGISEGRLYSPTDVQRLANGHSLIVDADNHRVIEVDLADQVVWQYGNAHNRLGQGQGLGDDQLDSPMSAWRGADGRTLVVDTGNQRVIEITPDKQVVWLCRIPPDGGRPLFAWRLADGQTIVSTDRFVFQISASGQPVGFLDYNQIMPPSPPTDDAESADTDGPRLERLAKETAKTYIKVQRGELGPIDVVLVDRARHRLFQVNRHKQIAWRLEEPQSPLDLRLQRPQMAELVTADRILITDTDNHRVIEVHKGTKDVIWQYGKLGVMGSGPGQLGHPRSATVTPADTVLISDSYSGRVLEVDRSGETVWSYGGWDDEAGGLTSPYHAQRLADGHTLITDWSGHQVIEVDPEGQVIWRFGAAREAGSDPRHLMYPEQAVRLDNGNTLVVDTRNARVLEIDPEGDIVWQYGADGVKPLSAPTQAQRLATGHTLIVHGANRQILEVTPDGDLAWQYALPPDRR